MKIQPCSFHWNGHTMDKFFTELLFFLFFRVFFRQHFHMKSILYCGIDPSDKRWEARVRLFLGFFYNKSFKVERNIGSCSLIIRVVVVLCAFEAVAPFGVVVAVDVVQCSRGSLSRCCVLWSCGSLAGRWNHAVRRSCGIWWKGGYFAALTVFVEKYFTALVFLYLIAGGIWRPLHTVGSQSKSRIRKEEIMPRLWRGWRGGGSLRADSSRLKSGILG